MLKTYRGRYEKGRIILQDQEQNLIPDNVNIIITVLEETPSIKTTAQQQLEAFNKFVSGIMAIDDEPLSEIAFNELKNNRVNFGRELDL
jgi:hypothetical protein